MLIVSDNRAGHPFSREWSGVPHTWLNNMLLFEGKEATDLKKMVFMADNIMEERTVCIDEGKSQEDFVQKDTFDGF